MAARAAGPGGRVLPAAPARALPAPTPPAPVRRAGAGAAPSPSGSTARKCALLSCTASWKCSAVFAMIQRCSSLALTFRSVSTSTLRAGTSQTGPGPEGQADRRAAGAPRAAANRHAPRRTPPGGTVGTLGSGRAPGCRERPGRVGGAPCCLSLSRRKREGPSPPGCTPGSVIGPGPPSLPPSQAAGGGAARAGRVSFWAETANGADRVQQESVRAAGLSGRRFRAALSLEPPWSLAAGTRVLRGNPRDQPCPVAPSPRPHLPAAQRASCRLAVSATVWWGCALAAPVAVRCSEVHRCLGAGSAATLPPEAPRAGPSSPPHLFPAQRQPIVLRLAPGPPEGGRPPKKAALRTLPQENQQPASINPGTPGERPGPRTRPPSGTPVSVAARPLSPDWPACPSSYP